MRVRLRVRATSVRQGSCASEAKREAAWIRVGFGVEVWGRVRVRVRVRVRGRVRGRGRGKG